MTARFAEGRYRGEKREVRFTDSWLCNFQSLQSCRTLICTHPSAYARWKAPLRDSYLRTVERILCLTTMCG